MVGLLQFSKEISAISLILFFGFGCAHAPVAPSGDPKDLLIQACDPGKAIRTSKGSVWIKAKSKEASGQFPAVVQVNGPESLKMEVTNLVGGTEAFITVEGKHYTIKVPGKKNASSEGSDSWGGIPLRWATELFLGRVPCPPQAERKTAQVVLTPKGELQVSARATLEHDAEKYVFTFKKWEGREWPEGLHWERLGSVPVSVDFKFDDPEEGTHSPKKWEAKSDRGEVKVRWKDREVTQ